ncbi:MAG: protein kinase [Myxococcales bacterium]|nr:protein kinase [Myxococcales bacterium]
MDDAESAEYEREREEEKARDRAEAEKLVGVVVGGKYRIEAFVGGGAMGKVYRATQLLLDKTVAVKVLHAGLGQDEKFQARFHREAKAASRMDHPNSVGVIDFGIERDGMMFIVMEFLAGRDLFTALRKEWPFSLERTVEVMSQVLSALAVAHDQGIVHRDLKPENVMLVPKKQDDGTMADVVKVADFGIAKIMDSHRSGANGERLSTAGNITGTPEYMSPEQAQARTVDGRADLYSCGIILYEMCTGKLPFYAETPIGVVLKHITENPADPRELNPALPEAMGALILKSLAKSPNDRFSDARSMRAALRAVIGMKDVTTTSLSAEAIAAIAAIDAKEGSDSVGQASTMVGLPTPAPFPAPSMSTSASAAAIAPRNETIQGMGAPATAPAPTSPRTPSGPKGDRTHSTTASVEVPVAQSSPVAPQQPASGVTKGTLVASIVAAVSIGALAVVGMSQRNNQSPAINAQPTTQAPLANTQDPARANPSNTPVANGNGAAQQPPQTQPEATPPTGTPSTGDPVAQPPANNVAGSNTQPTQNTGSPERTQRNARTQPSNNQGSNSAASGTNSAGTTPTTAPSGANPRVEPTPPNTQPTAGTNTTQTAQAAQNTAPANNGATTQTTATQQAQPQPQVVVAPTVPPLTGVRGSVSQLNASGGVLVNRLQGRAQTAADTLARCALQHARAQRAEASFTSAADVTLNITVVDRRIDRVRLLGGPAFMQGCGREAEPAFSGDLPEADDPEYTITLRVSLAPQR